MSYGKFKLVHREKQIAPDSDELSEEVEVLSFIPSNYNQSQAQAVCLRENNTVKEFPIGMLRKQIMTETGDGYLGENPIVET